MNKLIVLYTMKKTDYSGRSTVIELCGEFERWEHFERFQIVEMQRGWKVVTAKIIGERKGENNGNV